VVPGPIRLAWSRELIVKYLHHQIEKKGLIKPSYQPGRQAIRKEQEKTACKRKRKLPMHKRKGKESVITSNWRASAINSKVFRKTGVWDDGSNESDHEMMVKEEKTKKLKEKENISVFFKRCPRKKKKKAGKNLRERSSAVKL